MSVVYAQYNQCQPLSIFESLGETFLHVVSRDLPEAVSWAVVELHSVNRQGAVEHLAANKPDIAITFGVGRVMPSIFEVPRWGTLNVHRGITQRYRGLDSDLWAIQEGNFDQIGVTTHFVDAQLDTGAIVAQRFVPIEPGSALHHLRYETTLVATELVTDNLRTANRERRPPEAKPQTELGAYYSAMPLETKFETLERFRKLQEGHAQ